MSKNLTNFVNTKTSPSEVVDTVIAKTEENLKTKRIYEQDRNRYFTQLNIENTEGITRSVVKEMNNRWPEEVIIFPSQWRMSDNKTISGQYLHAGGVEIHLKNLPVNTLPPIFGEMLSSGIESTEVNPHSNILRNVSPNVILNNIIGVQPMQAPVTQINKLKTKN